RLPAQAVVETVADCIDVHCMPHSATELLVPHLHFIRLVVHMAFLIVPFTAFETDVSLRTFDMRKPFHTFHLGYIRELVRREVDGDIRFTRFHRIRYG